MTKAIGIDLGTTFTCVAYMKGPEEVEVVSNLHGNKTTPSVVHFGPDETKVGEGALAMRGRDPKNTIFQVKRFMGRDALDPEIQKRTYPFEIVVAKKGHANIRVSPSGEGKTNETKIYCPEQVSADIIRYAKMIAEESIGEKVEAAVITVPANFTNAQRQATKDAGEIAGLTVLRIVNEPAAAALAYGFERKTSTESRVILVYDLGGGTFDVSIVVMKGTEAEVKSTQGLTFLGGEDFDYRIYEEAVSEFKKRGLLGVSIPKENEFSLHQSCEQAKRTLSTCDTAEIATFDEQGGKQTFIISRETFDELCQDLFEKTIECVKYAIKASGYEMKAIDEVVLVGGSSRIPRVQTLLKDIFTDQRLMFDIPPDHAIAQGAAMLAASLEDKPQPKLRGAPATPIVHPFIDDKIPTSPKIHEEAVNPKVKEDVLPKIHIPAPAAPKSIEGGAVKLVDVTPFSLGIKVPYDNLQVIINRNSRYPTTRTVLFSNAEANIYEGEMAIASQNNLLGNLEIACPPKSIGENEMETTFSIDADGLLHLHVKDLETGKEAQIKVESGKLSALERNRMTIEAENREEHEKIQKAKKLARTAFSDSLMRVKTSIQRAESEQKQRIIEIMTREENWIRSCDPSDEELHTRAKAIREELAKLKSQ